MATTPKVLLKRSSVAGRIPTASDLEYGELAINFADGKIHYKDNTNTIKSFIDSARVQAIADAVETVALAQLDSSEITSLVDSAYVNARLDTSSFLDSAEAVQLIDSAYVRSKIDAAFINSLTIDADTLNGQTSGYHLDYNNFTNTPTVLDSAQVIAEVAANSVDSAKVLSLIDSAYVTARQSDSAVNATNALTLGGQNLNFVRNYNNLTNTPVVLDTVDVSNIVTADVDKAFVDALNVDADTLDGQNGTHYLDYTNFTNKPALIDSGLTTQLIDSAYIQLRDTPQDFAYASLTGKPTIPAFGTDYVDSQTVLDIITSEGLDSDLVISLVDSAYIALRDRFQDSSLVTSTVDAAYVQARQIQYNTSNFTDSAFVTNLPVSTFTNDAGYLTAATVGGLDSNLVTQLIDSAYVKQRVTTDQDLLSTSEVDFGSVDAPIVFTAKNASGSTLYAREVIYINGVSGEVPTVDRAHADDPATMPAFGMVKENANNNANVQVITFGSLHGVSTDSFSAGDTLYVSTVPGRVTNTRPTGESNQLQNIGKVVRSHSASGVIRVGGAGRTNATPNLDNDKFFLGDSTNCSVSTNFTAAVTNVVDSAYVQARQTAQDFAYGSLTGAPTIPTLGTDFVDSDQVIAIVDSAYVAARTTAGTDSAAIIQLIDSAYVAARTSAGTDSATVISLIQSANDSDTTNRITARVFRITSLSELDTLATHTGLGVPNGTAKIGDIAYKLNPFDGYVLTNVYAPTSYQNSGFHVQTNNGTVTRMFFDVVPAGQLPSQNFAVGTLIAVNSGGGDVRTVTAVSDTGGTYGKGYLDFTPSDAGYAPGWDNKTVWVSATNQSTWQTFGLDSAAFTGIVDSDYVRLHTRIGDSDIDFGSNKILYSNVYSTEGDLPSASTYHGMFAHVHGTGAAYFAHAGAWVKLANYSDINPYSDAHVTALVDSAYIALRDRFQDSAGIAAVVDSAYIQARQTSGGGGTVDSADIIAIVDSAYVQARQTASGGGIDSATVLSLIDSSYVQNRQTSIITGDAVEITKFVYQADSAQTVFTGADKNNVTLVYNNIATEINVYLNGILQVDSDDFVQTDSSTVTLVQAANLNDIIQIFRYTPSAGTATGVDSASTIQLIDSAYVQARQTAASRGTLDVNKFTFDTIANQTVFSGNDKFGKSLILKAPENTEVYLNGLVLISPTDYIIDSNSVTLTEVVDSGFILSVTETVGDVNLKSKFVRTGYEFAADSGQTVFSNSMDLSQGATDVYFNGILLQNLNDYTISANVLTLTSPADSGDLIVINNNKTAAVSGLNLATFEFTNQTTNSLSRNGFAYTPGSIQVFKNNQLLQGKHYTAIDGTTINLNVAAVDSDEFTVNAFSSTGTLASQFDFIADSGATTITGLDRNNNTLVYDVGNIVVFVNGISLIDSADFSATNGFSVSFVDALSINDEVKIVAFGKTASVTTPPVRYLSRDSGDTLTVGDKAILDTTSSAPTISLPATAALGDEVRVIDGTGNANTNNITIDRNGHKIQGVADNLIIDVDRAAIGLVYYNSTNGWILTEN